MASPAEAEGRSQPAPAGKESRLWLEPHPGTAPAASPRPGSAAIMKVSPVDVLSSRVRAAAVHPPPNLEDILAGPDLKPLPL